MSSISVIIATWNRANTIEKAVCSALTQTLPPIEVLVCDDGSTDNTFEVIRSINDDRIKWITGPRGGRPAIPRNRGIKESRGEWLAFLDSDDEWLSEKLEKQLALVEKSKCRAVCSNAHRFIPDKGLEGNLLTWDSELLTFDNLLWMNRVICSSVLVHKSLFSIVYGFPEDANLKASEDYALWLRIATLTDFAFITEPLLIYRDDAANSIRRENADIWNQRRVVLSDFRNWGERQGISARFIRKTRRQALSDLLKSKIEMLVKAIRMKIFSRNENPPCR